ncbi:hypothetical protein AVEN_38768-1 [Araneus ventricosus]|uniref:Uncharacterized protein n=1 Tax=Araneus ventricosus TaxID=182803 RepID=A0A4Y2PIY4_ARAVE|nr:hypothetical protein AVEN_38768-1 [Araneus ventricosus]
MFRETRIGKATKTSRLQSRVIRLKTGHADRHGQALRFLHYSPHRSGQHNPITCHRSGQIKEPHHHCCTIRLAMSTLMGKLYLIVNWRCPEAG